MKREKTWKNMQNIILYKRCFIFIAFQTLFKALYLRGSLWVV